MRLYKYLSTEFGLKVIRERRLKISRLTELNDPFEFLGVDLTDRDFRHALNRSKAQLSQKHGLICLSRTWQSPVLWAHYADNHKGICLGFEVEREFVADVDYVNARFPHPDVVNEAFMKKLLFTKFEHWSYEQESRAYVSLDEPDGEHYYLNFSEGFSLQTAIVGHRSSTTRKELADALSGLDGQVEVFKARPGFTRFEVVRNKDPMHWA